MKLKFKDQQFQIDATAAVCDVFEGQPYHDPTVYTVDPGESAKCGVQSAELFEDPPDVGYANAEIKISGSEMLKNLHMVQDRNNLERTGGAAGVRALPELEVEMETGTGKTFVYTKTIFELNKRYGWSKFIIIVPGVAIREGVKKSIDITSEKFFADYGKTAKTFIYNSSHPQDILDFSTNPDIQIIVMNVQAFNARGADARRIFMALDEFGSRKPIDLIAANRPILILDEPQKMEGTATQEMLPKTRVLTESDAGNINFWLKFEGYIDRGTDEITQKWREERDGGQGLKTLPGEFFPYRDSLVALIDKVRDPNLGKKMIGRQPRILEPNDNIKKSEFVELWKRINHKTVYTVKFDSAELVKKSVEALNKEICIPKITYAEKHFKALSGADFKYHVVTNYEDLLAQCGTTCQIQTQGRRKMSLLGWVVGAALLDEWDHREEEEREKEEIRCQILVVMFPTLV